MNKALEGKSILVASGPTTAPLDYVRFITNRSSGRLGSVIAHALCQHGANVEQLAGQRSVTVGSMYPGHGFENLAITRFETVDDLKTLMRSRLESQIVDVVIMAAAVLDYIPERIEGKKPSCDDEWTVKFHRGEKLIEQFQHWRPETLVVGFKLETGISEQELFKRAEQLMERSHAKIVVANRLEDVSHTDHTAYLVYKTNRGVNLSGPLASREEIAERLAAELINQLG